MVHSLWFWSHSFSCYRTTAHTLAHMVKKTWTSLSECSFQCGRIWRTQVFCECRSWAIDWGDDDMHGMNCSFSLQQCRIEMVICHRGVGSFDWKYEARLGKESKRKNKNKALSTSHKKIMTMAKNWRYSGRMKKGVWLISGKAPSTKWLYFWVPSTIIADRFLSLVSTVPSMTPTW